MSIKENKGQDYSHLKQNYPNPFNGSTMINYTVEDKGVVQILIYSDDGRVIKELKNDMHNPGEYNIEFDASGMAKGTYLCRMLAGDRNSTIFMILE